MKETSLFKKNPDYMSLLSQNKETQHTHNPGAFTKPRVASPSAFEQTEWGGRFPNNTYFPMYLANGRDAVLVNITGSGDGWWERSPSAGDVINKLHAVGWYKADRRVKRPDLGVYGPLYSLMEFTACPLVDGEPLVPRDVRQYFDPRSATLTTIYRQIDNRTGIWTELLIRTYLSSQSILVQEIHVVSAPDCGIQYSFTLNTPSYGYQNTTIPVAQPDTFHFTQERDGSEIEGRMGWGDNRAIGLSVVTGVAVQEVRRREIPEQKLIEIEQRTAFLFVGDTIQRFVIIKDTFEGDDAENAIEGIRQEIRVSGAEEIQRKHIEEWETYFTSSELQVPEPAVQYLYDLSRYILKANHHEWGLQPCGILPYQWQGAMFWDGSFTVDALLGCKNDREAETIMKHVKSFLPQARALAKSHGNGGARIEWTLNLRDFSLYPEPSRQFHNNAVWALAVCKLLDATSDRKDVVEYLGFCEELLLFLCDEVMGDHLSNHEWTSLIGIDESVEAVKSNDTWTIAVFLCALRHFDRHCRSLNHVHGLSKLDRVVKVLDELLAGNMDAEKVLHSFQGGKIPHWGSLVFDLMPDHPSSQPTLAKMSQNYDHVSDMFNFHGLSRYSEKAFPWANFWYARCLARTNNESAFDYFLNGTRLCNYFGGFSERIFYHGEHYISWFSSAHATLVWGLQGMIGHVAGDTLYLLPGINGNEWKNIEASGLYIGDGLEISLATREGKLVKLGIYNRNKEAALLKLSSRFLPELRELTLSNGWNDVI